MTGAGRRAQRTCLGCRGLFDQDLLVRFVLSPRGEVLVDYRKRLPGRGAYTCLSRQCLAAAVKRRQFDRALRGGNLQVSEKELAAALSRQVEERILNLLGMARKAGEVIGGSNLVLDALGGNPPPPLVVMAADAVSGIGEKVQGKARSRNVLFFRLFDKTTLGRLMGREERSVLALRPGRLAEAIRNELGRFKSIAGEG